MATPHPHPKDSASRRQCFVGLDMGGTDIKGTVISDEGEVLVSGFDKVLSLASEGPRRTVQQMRIAAEQALERAGVSWDDVRAVGLDTPGPATLDGVLSRSPNLDHEDWEGFAVRRALEEELGRPVIYANDGNAAAYWEYFRLYGDDPSRILGAAILGTGLGGALVAGGTVLTGARGFGAEFGHVRLPSHRLPDPIDPDYVPVCGCGKEACAEAYVSLAALDTHLRRALERDERWRDHELQGIEDRGRDRAVTLLGRAQRGDELALELFDRQAVALGLLFVQLANCFDPHVFIVGGGLTESSDEFRERFMRQVRETFRAEAFPKPAEEVEIEFAGDQDWAGCRGSALLARHEARAGAI